MRIGCYGSSLLSSYWNGAATYYRGLIRALAARGHRVAFFEPRAYQRQENAAIEPPDWCEVVVFEPDAAGLADVLAQARRFDVVVKTSGVGVLDTELLEGVHRAAAPGALRVFLDVDAPATQAEIAGDPDNPLRRLLPDLDFVLTYGGGWRALLGAFAAQGGRVTFLERDMPWYAAHRDLPAPEYARLHLYGGLGELRSRFARRVREADAVLVGSYVPDGVAVIDWALETARGPVAFYDIDTPVTLAKLSRGDEDYLARRQIPLFDLYFSFTGGPTLDRLRREFGARRAEALYCTVDTARYRHRTEVRRRWRMGYVGTYSDDRQPTLARLLIEPARRRARDAFVVAGPQYPGSIEWPVNVTRIEHCPPAEHELFYNSQDFTLNVTRAEMVAAGWSPSVRLFEAAACAVPIVSDRWDGLDRLFPDGSLIIADGPEDVLAALDLPEARRRQIGRAAQEVVHAGHRAEVRARQLAAHLQAALGRRTESAA